MDFESGLVEIEDRVNAKLKVLIPDIQKILNAFELSKEDTLNRHAFLSVHIQRINDRISKIEKQVQKCQETLVVHEEAIAVVSKALDDETWQESMSIFWKASLSASLDWVKNIFEKPSSKYIAICTIGTILLVSLKSTSLDHDEL